MPQNVEGPRREPLPYGLFSVVDLPNPERTNWQGDGIQWEGISCAPASGLQIVCEPGEDTIGFPKDFFSLMNVGQAAPFVVYGSSLCLPTRLEEGQDQATQHLLTREEARAEQAFWTGDLGNYPSLEHPNPEDQAEVAVTLGGGIVTPEVAIALLEDWIATNYGSLGVIHVTRGAATILVAESVVDSKNGRLYTELGTPVVAGAGYPGTSPAGAAPAAGTTWAYASPAIFGYRSEVFPASERLGDLLDRDTNNFYAVAERTYILGFDDCGTAAVNFALDGSP